MPSLRHDKYHGVLPCLFISYPTVLQGPVEGADGLQEGQCLGESNPVVIGDDRVDLAIIGDPSRKVGEGVVLGH